MVTLLHFTHPLWLEDKGGFANDVAPEAFVKFSRRMYAEYGGKVREKEEGREKEKGREKGEWRKKEENT